LLHHEGNAAFPECEHCAECGEVYG
jgi:hypothetical protein